MRVVHVAGARPNFIKIAPVMKAISSRSGIEQYLVHTGQHYDDAMSRVFFDDLCIPRPEVNLNVGSGSHAAQTAAIMTRFEPACLDLRPDLVLVVGDVNSTVACALVAAKLGVKVGHVEAGLRSFDWSMPEEINRVVTDRLSDFLFTTEPSANENLRREGIPGERVHFVGNVMIDTLLAHRDRARSLGVRERMRLEAGGYALVTLHRPSNVDTAETLRPIVQALASLSYELPVIFPAHPRTVQGLSAAGLGKDLGRTRLLEPLGYLEFLALMSGAALVLTDSGGVQEETTVLGVPCLTLRPNTERPITVEQGTNRLVPLDADAIVEAALLAANGDAGRHGKLPELWDGAAAERIADILAERAAAAAR